MTVNGLAPLVIRPPGLHPERSSRVRFRAEDPPPLPPEMAEAETTPKALGRLTDAVTKLNQDSNWNGSSNHNTMWRTAFLIVLCLVGIRSCSHLGDIAAELKKIRENQDRQILRSEQKLEQR